MGIRIAIKTWETVAPIVKGLAQSGALPKTEASAATTLLKQATIEEKKKKKGDDARKEPFLMTIAQAAKRLNCSKRTIGRLLEDKLLTKRYIRASKSNKSLRISSRELDKIIEGGEQC